ncbi:MAG: hypothetical protein AB7E05_01025 [Sphingobium sp.]
MSIRPLVALMAFLLSACAGVGQDGRGYPSLARRSVETQGSAETGAVAGEEAAEVEAAEGGAAESGGGISPAIDASLRDQLSGLSRQADQGAEKFDRLYGQVSGAIRVSAAAAISSEQWVVAQQSLGRLEQARYDSVFALASLDTLYVERLKDVADGKADGGVEDIGAVREKALAIVDSQNDRVDRLRTLLKQP